MSVVVIGDVKIVYRAQQSHEFQEVSSRGDASAQSQDIDASSQLHAPKYVGIPSKTAHVRNHTQIVHLRPNIHTYIHICIHTCII